jgi:ribosomal-protein-alanine N-acetyltransferase
MSKSNMQRVRLERPSKKRAHEFLLGVRRSRDLHRNRTTPPSTLSGYHDYLKRLRDSRRVCFFVVDDLTGDLVGVVEITEIVRGSFQSGYLGYYALVPHNGKVYIRAGLIQAINYAFGEQKLHRLEANIQPDNDASICLVRSLGFQLEGFSPRYLKISGRWRDHERWAIRKEEWRPRVNQRSK